MFELIESFYDRYRRHPALGVFCDGFESGDTSGWGSGGASESPTRYAAPMSGSDDSMAPIESLRVLVLEPFHGGSHRAFLDGWAAHGRHRFTVLGLPPHRWKWRMRHGALTLADEVKARFEAGERWDAVFASDMLDLAQWRGLAPTPVAALPTVVYFHENQLTYPVRVEAERDLHFAFTNITTALAACRGEGGGEVWWNSAFHRDDFLAAVDRLWRRLPDHQPKHASGVIRGHSRVLPQGIDLGPLGSEESGSTTGPLHLAPLNITWAARWEHDKNPDAFFDALEPLVRDGLPFRVSVLGESFREVPPVFERAREFLGERVAHWGWLDFRRDYLRALAEADVFVSTADHEFFGVAAVEAMALGCRPLLPDRLAYPELLAPLDAHQRADFLYADGTLEARLRQLVREHEAGRGPWPDSATGAASEVCQAVREATEPYLWPRLAPRLDRALAAVVNTNVARAARAGAGDQGFRP